MHDGKEMLPPLDPNDPMGIRKKHAKRGLIYCTRENCPFWYVHWHPEDQR